MALKYRICRSNEGKNHNFSFIKRKERFMLIPPVLLKRLYLWLSYLTDITIEKRYSELSGDLFIRWRNGRLVVDTEAVNYAYGSLYDVFKLAFQKVDVNNRVKPKRVLLAGFGAGSVYRLVRETFGEQVSVVGLELDPVMIQIYRDYYAAADPHLEVLQIDTCDYFKQTQDVFDLIIIDVFVGDEVPDKLFDEAALKAMESSLNQQGCLMWNVIVENEKQKQQFKRAIDYFNYSNNWFVLNRVNRMFYFFKN